MCVGVSGGGGSVSGGGGRVCVCESGWGKCVWV